MTENLIFICKGVIVTVKLVIAIVNKDDAAAVSRELLNNGYPATKMASTGGFLSQGNTTFLVGVSEKDVEGVIGVIKDNSSKRMHLASAPQALSPDQPQTNVRVTVGGATVFVIDVDRFVKL